MESKTSSSVAARDSQVLAFCITCCSDLRQTPNSSIPLFEILKYDGYLCYLKALTSSSGISVQNEDLMAFFLINACYCHSVFHSSQLKKKIQAHISYLPGEGPINQAADENVFPCFFVCTDAYKYLAYSTLSPTEDNIQTWGY